ncbi:DNA-3-methyladenine glycosylase [Mesorhizobium sp. M0816]|uniref:DNA-3-methyladenine glycosylase n=1 Tax=Mesorhizobium sp. M0816 TaxID=2957006 RepID=UPI00333A4CE4
MVIRRPIARSELPNDTAALARYLIGKVVVLELPEGVASGRIVETEAYVVGDAAGHGYRGMTPRNRSLFLERGHAYVYLAYDMSTMLNVSSEMQGIGTGVLIRALEPLEGIPIMRLNRGIERLRDLVRVPGRLATALRIDRSPTGSIFAGKALYGSHAMTTNPAKSGSIRIGISRDADRLLRFYVRQSPFVSGRGSQPVSGEQL